MGKLLETYGLPRLNHKVTENMGKFITSKDTETIIKKISQQIKVQDQMASLVNSTKYSKN